MKTRFLFVVVGGGHVQLLDSPERAAQTFNSHDDPGTKKQIYVLPVLPVYNHDDGHTVTLDELIEALDGVSRFEAGAIGAPPALLALADEVRIVKSDLMLSFEHQNAMLRNELNELRGVFNTELGKVRERVALVELQKAIEVTEPAPPTASGG